MYLRIYILNLCQSLTNINSKFSVYDNDLAGNDITEEGLNSIHLTQNTGIQAFNTHIHISQDIVMYGSVIDFAPFTYPNFRTQLFISWDGSIYVRGMLNGTWQNMDKYWSGWRKI